MTKAKQKKGLACLPPERVRQIASLGGKAAQRPGGRGHRWTKGEARAMRQAQLERKREEEEFQLRLRARLRRVLGPSPGPGSQDHEMPCGCIIANGEAIHRCAEHGGEA